MQNLYNLIYYREEVRHVHWLFSRINKSVASGTKDTRTPSILICLESCVGLRAIHVFDFNQQQVRRKSSQRRCSLSAKEGVLAPSDHSNLVTLDLTLAFGNGEMCLLDACNSGKEHLLDREAQLLIPETLSPAWC